MDISALDQQSEVEESDKPSYLIRPNYQHKFKKATVKECIHHVVANVLQGKQYDAEEVPNWIEQITNKIKEQLKDMEFDRYKFVVQCVIGEQRGQDVKMSCRCFWDSDTDNYAEEIFMNASIFCVTTAFGVFFY